MPRRKKGGNNLDIGFKIDFSGAEIEIVRRCSILLAMVSRLGEGGINLERACELRPRRSALAGQHQRGTEHEVGFRPVGAQVDGGAE